MDAAAAAPSNMRSNLPTRMLPRLIFAAALPVRNAHVAHVALRRTRPPQACINFFSTSTSSDADFPSLGLNPLLLPALTAAGIERPTEVQRAAFEMILNGEDSVLLSETGTGKTLAYTLPLVHRLIEYVEADEQAGAAGEAEAADERPRGRFRTPPNQALVLVPNRDLAAQVTSVISGVVEALPADLQSALRVSSLAAEVGADADATILVATPALALKLWRGPDTVRWVVMDEADALLAGSWKLTARMNYPIEQIIAQVKRAAKVEAKASRTTGPRASGRAERAKAFYASRQFVVTGATMPNAGTKNMEEHVKRLLPTAQWFLASRVHKSVDTIKHFFVKIDGEARAAALQQALKHGPQGKVLIFANTFEMAEAAVRQPGSIRPYLWDPSHPCYALPGPLALPCSHPEVSVDRYRAPQHADATIELGSDGCGMYHAGMSTAERAASLAAFERGEPSVLVCTGLASRGIDFADVAHVLQYDVATNAVEFMHRIGRTARAGKRGVATTLYTQDRAELIEGLRDALAEGKPVDHLFSRKRSFTLQRKKARKREAQMSAAVALGDDENVKSIDDLARQGKVPPRPKSRPPGKLTAKERMVAKRQAALDALGEW